LNDFDAKSTKSETVFFKTSKEKRKEKATDARQHRQGGQRQLAAQKLEQTLRTPLECGKRASDAPCRVWAAFLFR
jgi:hypothetical protein